MSSDTEDRSTVPGVDTSRDSCTHWAGTAEWLSSSELLFLAESLIRVLEIVTTGEYITVLWKCVAGVGRGSEWVSRGGASVDPNTFLKC